MACLCADVPLRTYSVFNLATLFLIDWLIDWHRLKKSQHMQCTHTKNTTHAKNRIDCERSVFHVHALHISVFWLRHKPCVRCVARVAYSNLETACRPTKTDLKVSFQAAVRNATQWAQHMLVMHADQKTATYAIHAHGKRDRRNDRIGCILCELRISVFLIASRASVALCVLRTTA